MSLVLDDIVRSLTNSNERTPLQTLKTTLHLLYEKSKQYGLSSPQLQELVRFICETSVIDTVTKVYIVENCFLPNEYLTKDPILEVINHLGTPTVFSRYRIQTPPVLQSALCKWLVHVYFLFPAPSEWGRNISGSIWLHLWQFSFLQKWITYLIIWQTSTPNDVKPWKVSIIRKCAMNPGYRDAPATATLILQRYQGLVGASNQLIELIININCNKKTLKNHKNLKLNPHFLSALQRILSRAHPASFPVEVVQNTVDMFLNEIHQLGTASTRPLRLQSLPGHSSSNGMVSLLDITSLDQLAQNWTQLYIPNDVDSMLAPSSNINSSLQPRVLSRESLRHLYPCITLIKNGRQTSSSSSSSSPREWCIWQLKRCFAHQAEAPRDLLYTIVSISSMDSELSYQIIQTFCNLKYLKHDEYTLKNICGGILPLWKPQLISGTREFFVKFIAGVLMWSTHDGYDNNRTFPEICFYILQMITNWLLDDKLMTLGLTLLHDIQSLLTLDQIFNNSTSNRFSTMAIITSLNVLTQLSTQSNSDYAIQYLILGPDIMNKIFTSDDPLLLSTACQYLIATKNKLMQYPPTNKYVQTQNQYIMDLTNYLYRNKVFSSKSLFGIPIDFFKMTLENVYVPTVDFKNLKFFTITGIPAYAYTCVIILKQLESTQNTRIKFTSGIINEETFKDFVRINHSEFTQQGWIKGISNINDLRVEILKHTSTTANPYSGIAVFLFTYLKSLSKYNPQNP
ncbi:chromosome transmission fidelity- protein [Saccharomyces pastorianus]|uniref:Chromosome transmission fidelity-protein n=1 Tax=Saccharomyces pastorianus TaxID=27292 RepID=A0A6C1EDP2_SACPS|nr:chromosome transmission fidelity- protein [Saccharomyces pastorianus]